MPKTVPRIEKPLAPDFPNQNQGFWHTLVYNLWTFGLHSEYDFKVVVVVLYEVRQ